jgi:hypothetical protein
MNIQRKINRVQANFWETIVNLLTHSPFVQALVELFGKIHLYKGLLWLLIVILLWLATGLTLLVLLLG